MLSLEGGTRRPSVPRARALRLQQVPAGAALMLPFLTALRLDTLLAVYGPRALTAVEGGGVPSSRIRKAARLTRPTVAAAA